MFSPEELKRKSDDLERKWQACAAGTEANSLVEFAVMVSSFTAYLETKGLSGLHQGAHGLEKDVLALLECGDALDAQAAQIATLSRQITEFHARIDGFVAGQISLQKDRRLGAGREAPVDALPVKKICLVTSAVAEWQDLVGKAACFNIQVEVDAARAVSFAGPEPLLVMVDAQTMSSDEFTGYVAALRARFAAGKIMGLNVRDEFDQMNAALNAGCDFCLAQGTTQGMVLSRIVKLCADEEEPAYRVLVVEDSKTASTLIQRTLREAGVESLAVARPQDVLRNLMAFKPDLVLMDMYMPGCTGVEVTRVIRQHAEFLSTPVVYLSGDADVALQVDALRLGGDHFLTKPFNPVVLNAVVTSKIERYRTLRRTMYMDSLTGLLNHTASKERLDEAVDAARAAGMPLSMAMIDIDHFKKVNDTYGHPVGDLVIRSLAWLLKMRLRKSDAVGRYGGEEFVVVMPGMTAAQAHEKLDRIRLDFAGFEIPWQGDSVRCAFSGGISALSQGTNAEALIQSADEGLYAAKRGGRNQIVIR